MRGISARWPACRSLFLLLVVVICMMTLQGMMGMNNMQHNGMGDGMNGMNSGMQVIFIIILRSKHIITIITNN